LLQSECRDLRDRNLHSVRKAEKPLLPVDLRKTPPVKLRAAPVLPLIRQEEAARVLANDMDELAEFSRMNNFVDFAGRMVWKEMTDKDGNTLLDAAGRPRRHEVFNFGKYRGWDVAEVLHRDPGYYSWMLAGDFTYNTKQVLTRIRLREFNNK